MRIPTSISLLAALLVGCSGVQQEPAAPANTANLSLAETVYTNGKIYTVDTDRTWAEAVAIKDGKFMAVGSSGEIAAFVGDATEVIDLAGAFVMPGIGDVHIHAALVMPKRAFCGLPGTFYEPTEEQTIAALKECIEKGKAAIESLLNV